VTVDFYKTGIEDMTLREAIAAYYRENATFTPYSQLRSERAQRLVRAHDISHLIFGCGTDLEGEVAVQLWTKHAVDIRVSALQKLAYLVQPEALKLVLNPQAIRFWTTRRSEVRRLNEDIRRRSHEMRRKWILFEEDQYMDCSVRELRTNLNVRIA